MPAHVETTTLEPGLTRYEISAGSHVDVMLEIERITGTAADHVAMFDPVRRSFDITDPVKRWRSRGYVRSLENA